MLASPHSLFGLQVTGKVSLLKEPIFQHFYLNLFSLEFLYFFPNTHLKPIKHQLVYMNILNFSDAFTEVWTLLTFDFLSKLPDITLSTNLVSGRNRIRITGFPISSFCIFSTCCLPAKSIAPIYLYITSASSLLHTSLIRHHTQCHFKKRVKERGGRGRERD